MAKHAPTGEDVYEFFESIDNKSKRKDAYTLDRIFQEVSGYEPLMWYPNIVGYGEYHYVYDSGHEGDAALVGFSPRKQKHSLYLYSDFDDKEYLLERFGKYTRGKGCIYVNKLADINTEVLKEMIALSIEETRSLYPN